MPRVQTIWNYELILNPFLRKCLQVESLVSTVSSNSWCYPTLFTFLNGDCFTVRNFLQKGIFWVMLLCAFQISYNSPTFHPSAPSIAACFALPPLLPYIYYSSFLIRARSLRDNNGHSVERKMRGGTVRAQLPYQLLLRPFREKRERESECLRRRVKSEWRIMTNEKFLYQE